MNSQLGFFDKYILTDKLGEGSFGSVFKCIHKESNKEYAIKKVDLKKDPVSLKRILREILLLKYLKHEHLICMRETSLGYQNKKTSLYFVMDLMQMNLRDLIREKRNMITNDHIKFYLYQIFLALSYLHYNDIVHRDIKPDNILINIDNEIKIADFGWARHIIRNSDLTKMIANIHYRAPEICFRNEYHDAKVDIWAVGCIFYEIITADILFKVKKDIDLLKTTLVKFGTLTEDELTFIEKEDAKKWVIKQGAKEKIKPSTYLGDLMCPLGKDLFDKCMEIDPRKRITSTDALQHPYFEEIFDAEEANTGMIKHSAEINFGFEFDENITGLQLFQRIEQETKNY